MDKRIIMTCALAACGTPAPTPDTCSTTIESAIATADLGRPILALPDGASVNASQMPTDFTEPQQTQCGPDTTRGYISELATHGLLDPKVPFHWAPVVSGPNPEQPTVDQPLFYVSGTVQDIVHGDGDFPFDHPFRPDITWNTKVDPEYQGLVFGRDADGGAENEDDALHTELSRGLLPEVGLGYEVRNGDRVALRGAWIFDCGHPPYSTELHPPSFLAFAREADATTTDSLAIVNPYRETQLYSADPADATAFADPGRYARAKPFIPAMFEQIVLGATRAIDRLQIHVLEEDTRFDPITWEVCAPAAKPKGATLWASAHLVTRTGVTLTRTDDPERGCVSFTARMSPAHAAYVPDRQDLAFEWSEMSSEASAEAGISIDVHQEIADAVTSIGFDPDVPALSVDNPPLIDTYPDLDAGPGADSAGSDVVTGADDRPFPFYARVQVGWCGR